VGGYEARLFLGAEEWLMALDLAARGWHMVYARELVTHHHPSPKARDPAGRCIAVARNKIWIACMRLPAGSAWQESMRALREAARRHVLLPAMLQAAAGLPWALRHRQVVPRRVSAMVKQLQTQV
jgi:hypothetical protein